VAHHRPKTNELVTPVQSCVVFAHRWCLGFPRTLPRTILPTLSSPSFAMASLIVTIPSLRTSPEYTWVAAVHAGRERTTRLFYEGLHMTKKCRYVSEFDGGSRVHVDFVPDRLLGRTETCIFYRALHAGRGPTSNERGRGYCIHAYGGGWPGDRAPSIHAAKRQVIDPSCDLETHT
jgi:hypothetical protein